MTDQTAASLVVSPVDDPSVVLKLTRPEAARLYSLLGMCQWALTACSDLPVLGPEHSHDINRKRERLAKRSEILEIIEDALINEVRPKRLESMQAAVYGALIEDDLNDADRPANAYKASVRAQELGFL